MPKQGIIQNEEVLYEVARTGSVFFIPCCDKADAHSKSVSLSNARIRMPLSLQKRVRVQRCQMDGIWGVKVIPDSQVLIYKLEGGKKIPWTSVDNAFTPDEHRMFEVMLQDGLGLQDILNNFPEDKADAVRELYLRETL